MLKTVKNNESISQSVGSTDRPIVKKKKIDQSINSVGKLHCTAVNIIRISTTAADRTKLSYHKQQYN